MINYKKRILAILMAIGMTFSILSLAGCNNANSSANSNPSAQPSSGDNNNQNSSNNNEYQNYSQTLQTVLTGKYYTDLILSDRVASKDYGNQLSFDNNQYKAIPYGFLEDEGYNIELVKNNVVDAESNMYTIGNDLFVELRIETKASTNYYTHYVIKYTLTEQEITELDLLFVPRYNSRFDTRVTNYQAPFFIQEVSYQKEATMLSKMYMTKDAVEAVEDYFDRNKYNSNGNHIMYMKQEIVEGSILEKTFHTFQTHAFVDGIFSSGGFKCKAKLSTITLQTTGTCCSTINSAFVFTNNDSYINFRLFDDKKLEYEKSTVDITLYSCENANFVELNVEELT